MPLTLPAHAAAVIPFRKLCPRWLSPTALIIGACAPDLAYLFAIPGRVSHHISGIALDVAIALAFVIWAKWLLLPELTPIAPSAFGIDWRAMLRTEAGRDARALPEIAGAVVGVLTHVLWDGFTHHGWWPAQALWKDVHVSLGATRLVLTELLWLLSTAFGTFAVWLFLRKRFPAPLTRFELNARLFAPMFAVLVASGAGGWMVASGAQVGAQYSRWNGTVAAAGCGLLALTAWTAWSRVRGAPATLGTARARQHGNSGTRSNPPRGV